MTHLTCRIGRRAASSEQGRNTWSSGKRGTKWATKDCCLTHQSKHWQLALETPDVGACARGREAAPATGSRRAGARTPQERFHVVPRDGGSQAACRGCRIGWTSLHEPLPYPPDQMATNDAAERRGRGGEQ